MLNSIMNIRESKVHQLTRNFIKSGQYTQFIAQIKQEIHFNLSEKLIIILSYTPVIVNVSSTLKNSINSRA